jgi:hypothetical protein
VGGACESKELYDVSVENREGKRPLRRPRRRWEDGSKMDLEEIGREGVDRDRWRVVMNLRVLAPRT